MAELSLTKLADGRQPVRLRALTCRTLQPFTDAEMVRSVGFGDLLERGGLVYGLPTNILEDETVLTVRIKDRYKEALEDLNMDALDEELRQSHPRMYKGEQVDEWTLTWEPLTKHLAETVPELVRKESDEFGGSSGLYVRVQELWGRGTPLTPPPPLQISAEYTAPQFRSKLLLSKPRDVGTFTATPAAAVWMIAGAPCLTSAAFLNPPQSERDTNEIRLYAFGRLTMVGTLDAKQLEHQLWQDVSQLLEETR